MKALILAAGIGSRLVPLTESYPKSLVPVNGKPIIFKQIENLLCNGINDITVVTGYKSDILDEKLRELYPQVNIIINKDYITTNNMYSAYLCKDYLKNQEFLMMNADVYFDSNIIKDLLRCTSENAIAVDIGNYNEESMKIKLNNGVISDISKAISQNEAYGVSIDIYKFSHNAGETFFNKCIEYIEYRNEKKLWSEVALNDVLKEVRFEVCEVKGRWYEIDNHEDLAKAERLFFDER